MSTPARKRRYLTVLEKALGEVFGLLATSLHSVWGRVVPDIPTFCRELVAALAEQ
jgi:hypothetical protein